MGKAPVRVMLVGGDIPTWVGLSAALGERTSQIYVPTEIASASLSEVDKDIDVVVVVTSITDTDPCAPLRVIRAAGMHRKTLVLADGDDQRTAAEALQVGIAGYLRRQATPEQVGAAVLQIARKVSFSTSRLLPSSMPGWVRPQVGWTLSWERPGRSPRHSSSRTPTPAVMRSA